MLRQELPHNTPEQTEAYLRDALALTERLAAPDDLRAAVFAAAASLLAAKQIVFEQPTNGAGVLLGGGR